MVETLAILKDLHSLLDSGDFSDVVLVVGAKEFRVHKNILAARSDVFRAMFSSDMAEQVTSRVVIEDIEVEVMELLLAYVYGDRIPGLDENTMELMIAADKVSHFMAHKSC